MTALDEQELHSHGKPGKIGLVLSGGGARGAYQAGAIKAIAEIAKDAGIEQPLPIITGVSAGAVNAAYLASKAENFMKATENLAGMWSNITADRVFRTDAVSAGRSGLRFLSDATVGALYKRKLARSLLDTTPLRAFLDEKIPFKRIDRNLAEGHLSALAVTATDYTTSTSITFVQSASEPPAWRRARRMSRAEKIRNEHVMASSAIPLFFPPVRIRDHHFGDGCLRNNAPLSPAIHLGADRLLVISVRKPDNQEPFANGDIEPSLARVIGVILNAILLDAVEVDMERMSRVNSTVGFVPQKQRTDLSLRELDYLWLRPSHDIGHLAGELFNHLPRVIRYLVSGLGSSREAAELTSYLLFDPDFCGQLVRIGYEDAMASKDKIKTFLTGNDSNS